LPKTASLCRLFLTEEFFESLQTNINQIT